MSRGNGFTVIRQGKSYNFQTKIVLLIYRAKSPGILTESRGKSFGQRTKSGLAGG